MLRKIFVIYLKRLNLPVFLERETSVNSIALGISVFVTLTPILLYSNTKELYRTIKKDVISDELKKKEVISSLYSINQKIKEFRPKISKVTDKVLKIQDQSEELAQNLIKMEKEIQFNQKQLSNNLRSRYKLKNPLIMNLFISKDPHQLRKNILFLKRINQRDFQLIQNLKSEFREIHLSREKLKKKLQTLLSLKKKLELEEQSLHQIQEKKILLVSQIKERLKNNLSEISKIREFLHLETSFFERKGKIIHPVNGRISHKYGVIRDPHYRYRLTHKGYFYQAPKGSPIYGVHKGRVAYSGTLDGYGNVVIIDHGDSYHTVYAGHESVSVKEGQQVNQGSLIGSVGLSKRHKKIGAYFEIRHFADAINPKQWLINEKIRAL